ncbi:MAG TPA: lytic transglycosylase domain-containing protein [Firmicutes bacterium]|nr:lytic transglycosylase domain-containing protein [Bacillota bacterium]
MKTRSIKIDDLTLLSLRALLPLYCGLLLSIFFSVFFVSHTEKRLAAVESTLTQLVADLELVHEVFDEAQKIKDHIDRRSKISSEQVQEVTYAILHCAHQKKLNPYLLLAIAETESSFYPQAVGKVGERGLVQVRYGTFKMMMQEGDFYHWRDTLEAGANYLVYLLNRFKGNTILALAGYNAGPNRTRDRLLEIGRPYVRKVETNYTRIVRNNEYVRTVYGPDLTTSGWAGNGGVSTA